jgi:hypothetical protein
MSDALTMSYHGQQNHRSGGACAATASGGGGSRPNGASRSRGSSIPTSESFSTTDPSKLSDHELDCLKEAFSLFDADHDGEITVGELSKVMRNHGLNPTDEELSDMIRYLKFPALLNK